MYHGCAVGLWYGYSSLWYNNPNVLRGAPFYYLIITQNLRVLPFYGTHGMTMAHFRKVRGSPGCSFCPQKSEILPPLPTERSPAQQTSALSYHKVHLHPGYRAIHFVMLLVAIVWHAGYRWDESPFWSY